MATDRKIYNRNAGGCISLFQASSYDEGKYTKETLREEK